MIVTPRDFPITKYTVAALGRAVRSHDTFSAVIFCNGLSQAQIASLAGLVRKYPRLSIEDNSAYLASIRKNLQVGTFVQASGSVEERQGFFETAPEIWSRELYRLAAEYVVMFDPDFEILDDIFVHEIIEGLSSNNKIGFYSTNFADSRECFEIYSRENAIIVRRFHTWFCAYRREALEKYHDFSYFEDRSGPIPVKYDHSAMLQEVLIERHGYLGKSLSGEHADRFLHYGAFSQNRSLRGLRLWLYRLVRIGRHSGWRHKHHSAQLARLIRKLSAIAWKLLGLGRFDSERMIHAHQVEMQRSVLEGHIA